MTGKRKKAPTPVFEARLCHEPGCGTIYAPSGPNAKYCPDHQDARLRARGRWGQLRERSKRRAVAGDRCECCGSPANGGSYHGVVCCAGCRGDAEQYARERLLERASPPIHGVGSADYTPAL